jgi:hypothetical protein
MVLFPVMGTLAKFFRRIATAIPLVILGAIMFAAQVPPDAAVSNVSKWATLFHIPIPDAIKNKSADKWVFWICLLFAISYLIIWGISYWLTRKKSKNAPQEELKPMGKYYIGAIGVQILGDCGMDVSAATVAQLKVEKPDGTLVTWTAKPIIINGSPNWLSYTTASGDLDQVGRYAVQPYLEIGEFSGLGETAYFDVFRPFK